MTELLLFILKTGIILLAVSLVVYLVYDIIRMKWYTKDHKIKRKSRAISELIDDNTIIIITNNKFNIRK